MPSESRRLWPALALVALALALRCYGLRAPLLDYHSWRQADTAAIARNYAANGYHLLYPQVDWGGLTPGYVESEFPLYTYSLALLYGLFGDYVWLGRLLTALAGVASVVALYGLIRSSADQPGATAPSRVALYAGLALALMPFPVYFGRTVMPDTWMLLAAILAIWTFRRWLDRPSTGRYLVALLCGALAPLAKTPNLLIVAVPLTYLLVANWLGRGSADGWRHKTRLSRGRRVGALALYSFCFVIPSLLWLLHARALPLDPRLSFGIGEKLFDIRLLLDPQFYRLLARWSVDHVITLAGLPFFLLGLVPRIKNREPRTASHPTKNIEQRTKPVLLVDVLESRGAEGYNEQGIDGLQTTGYGQDRQHATRDTRLAFPLLPHFWLLGVLLFFLAGASGLVGQDYYILPLAGPAAWFIGVGLDRAQRFVEAVASQFAIRNSQFAILLPAVVLVALAALSFVHVAPLYHTTDFYQILGRRLDMALPAGARVGVIAPAVSEILYYGERKGWRLDPGVLVPGGLASLPPDLGVRYVLVADPALTERRELLTAALREYRRIPIGPYALLLDLAQPGLQRPAEVIWETGHVVEEPFLGYWRAAGGAERLGYPLSDALDGPVGREQYFERALLIQKGSHVERQPVGRLLLTALRRTPQPAEVAESFRAAWNQAGAEQGLGLPLSPPLDESGVQVQFFEFGMLESPPGGQAVAGAAGRRLLDARGLTEERQIELLSPRR